MIVLCAALLLPASAPASAEDAWPSKPIRLIVPFPAGSATDAAARVVGNRLGMLLKQPVIIDNRGGASGYIAADAVRHALPDGYTLLLGTASTQAVSVALNPALSYKPETDFAPVGLIGSSPYVIVTPPSTGLKTIADVIAKSRAKPGVLTYASAGNTSMANFAAQLLASATRIQMTHVPYKTSAQAVTDTLSGNVDLQFGTVTPVLTFVKAGSLRALAVTGNTRMALLPDVPTVAESGVPGYEAGLWMGLFTPKGTPEPVLDKLSRALKTTLDDAPLRSALNAQGIQVTPGSRPELAALVRQEIVKWTQVAKAAGISGE